jgi:outer membrane receptor protein involved in Fe transport
MASLFSFFVFLAALPASPEPTSEEETTVSPAAEEDSPQESAEHSPKEPGETPVPTESIPPAAPIENPTIKPAVLPEAADASSAIPVKDSPKGVISDEATTYMQLSLEELLDLPVSTPSRRTETMHQSAAIVSLITAAEIEDMAPTRLSDLLNTVPGIEVIETLAASTLVTFRGVTGGETNTSLMLINGHPLREFQGGVYSLDIIPVQSIKQIEIIRGPGSVQYGSGAFAGVINIITKNTTKKETADFNVTAGRYDTVDIGASGTVQTGNVSWFLAAQHHDSRGYPVTLNTPPQPTFRYGIKFDDVLAQMNWKDLKLSAGYSSQERSVFAGGLRWVDWYYADATYQHAISDSLSVIVMLLYDGGRARELYTVEHPFLNKDDTEGARGYHWGSDLRINWHALDSIRLSGGIGYERTFEYATTDTIAGSLMIPRSEESDFHLFAEANANLFGRLGLTAGARFDYNSISGGLIVPRAGLVFNATDDLAIKLLYGRAYRTPNFTERYSFFGGDTKGLSPVPPNDPLPEQTLRPVVIDTIELGTDWKLGAHTLRINAFYLNVTDVVSFGSPPVRLAALTDANGVPIPGEAHPLLSNVDGYSVIGAEAEIRGYPIHDFFYFANVSTKYAYKDDLSNELQRTPILGNVGFTYHLPAYFRTKLTTYVTVTGERTYTGSPVGLHPFGSPSGLPVMEYKTDVYALWNATLTHQFSPQVALSVIVQNILNTKYNYLFDHMGAGIVELPAMPFSAYARLTMHF